ncbi:MAG: phage holin family protein [Thermoanaerobaculia bacterium]|nr:phage holin family protein [Thermoanaerobaculia bacterium]MBP9824960.1 phage holin family protein [Thermoanaerobaculia bacterium]
MTKPAGWIARVQNLGSAYFAVVRAEISAALADLAESGRSLLRAALLFTITLALGFWTVGLLVYFLIEMLALWLPRWGAVGIVFAVFVLGTVLFAMASVARARRIEAPTAMLDRRLRDHTAWWQSRLGAEDEGSAVAELGDEEER